MMQRRFSCIPANQQQQRNGSAPGSGAATPSATTSSASGAAFLSSRGAAASVQARAPSLRRTSAQESVDSAFQLLSTGGSRRKGSADACVGQLQPDLYRRRGSVISVGGSGASGSGASGAPALGRVQMQLSYDHSTSDLVVRIAQVNLLQAGAASAFNGVCRLRLSAAHASDACRGRVRDTPPLTFDAQSGACTRGLPAEPLKLPLSYADLGQASLQVELVHADPQADARRHAACSVPLGALGPSADDLTVWADLERAEEAMLRGELLLCLQYLSAAERLTLSVHQASNLRVTPTTAPACTASASSAGAPAASAGAPADVFVRATLIGPDEKVLKRRKSGVRKWCAEPVWDEQLSFADADPHLLPRCRLEVQLVGADRFGRGERLIGQVQFCSPQGPNAPPPTRASLTASRLWRDALQRRWSVPRWVPLEQGGSVASTTAPPTPAAAADAEG